MHLHDSRKAASGLEPLWLQCPMTQGPISIDIATDVRSLTKAWHSKIKIACPHCPETHHFKVSEAFTNAAISDDRQSVALAVGVIRSWMEGNRPFRGPNWSSGIELALR